jgi:tripartite-type tricarboxylate transporter receptor subunit TctC
MTVVRLCVLLIAAIIASSQNAGPAVAQDYPTRQVTIVVPFAPGGSVDFIGRLVGQKLAERLGRPVIVENRPGAGSATGTLAVTKAAPDGYTLLLAPSGTFAINPTLYKQLSYDPASDLIPVALVVRDPLLLVVNPTLPVKSVADLIRLAKEKPGKLSFASPGAGTSLHLLGEFLKVTAGIEMVHVPYRGGAPAMQDLVAGQVDLMFADPATGVPQAQAGKVRALGVSSATRLPAAPDIPTVAEAGLPGFEMVSWQLIAAPAGTPGDIVAKLNGALKSAMADPDMQKAVIARGQVPVVSSPPQELTAFVAAENSRWGKVVREAGLAGSL